MTSAREGNPSAAVTGATIRAALSTSASPSSLQNASSAPRSVSGSPSVLISQSSTATMRPGTRRVQHGVVEPVVAVHDRVDALRQAASATRSSRSASSAGSSSVRDASHCFDQRRSWRSMKPAGRPNSASPTAPGSVVCRRGEHVDERVADGLALVRVRRRSRVAARCGRCARARAPSRRTALRAGCRRRRCGACAARAPRFPRARRAPGARAPCRAPWAGCGRAAGGAG